jgi:WD40 repeat protein
LSERVFGLGDPNATEPELPFTLNFENANLNGSRLRGSQWRGVNLQNATITQTQAQQSRWSGCNLQGADFKQSDLTASVFRGNLMIKAPAQLDLKNIRFLKNSPALSPLPAHQASLKWLISGHQDRINFCVYSPDGNTILTVSDDHTARLWNASNGDLIHLLEGHSGMLRHGAFSSDGNTILTVSSDHTARLWNASNGHLIHSLEGHSGWVRHGAFSPDGNTILTVSKDNTMRQWWPTKANGSLVMNEPRIFWHFENGYASGYKNNPQLCDSGGTAWYYLQALGDDINGESRLSSLEDITELGPNPSGIKSARSN